MRNVSPKEYSQQTRWPHIYAIIFIRSFHCFFLLTGRRNYCIFTNENGLFKKRATFIITINPFSKEKRASKEGLKKKNWGAFYGLLSKMLMLALSKHKKKNKTIQIHKLWTKTWDRHWQNVDCCSSTHEIDFNFSNIWKSSVLTFKCSFFLFLHFIVCIIASF